jgi:type II secretory pathway component PulM
MKAWFYGLQMRERWIVAAGALAALVIVVWGFVMTPLRAEIATLRTAVDTKQRLLIDVTRIENDQPAAIAGNREGAGQALVVIVANTAASHGLDFPTNRPNGPSGVNVSFQGASFDSLMAWLLALHDTYGVDVESASFSSAREVGLVNGQISLRRL